MIRYVCDMCGKSIDSENDERFRVLIDVEQMQPGDDDSDLDVDLPDEIPFDELDRIPENEEGFFKSFKFDLCPECAETYLQDPLSRKLPRRMRFMDN